ncbi:MAG: hypothetical protein ACK4V6_12160 [Microthrixaceae bacterium]
MRGTGVAGCLAVVAALGGGCTSGQSDPATGPDCAVAPEYTRTSTLFGVSLSSGDGPLPDALATNDELFGRLPLIRQFDTTLPPEDAWSRRAEWFAGRSMVTSFRADPSRILSGEDDARLLEHFGEAPTGSPIFWSYFHEPELHIDDGEFSAEEYRAAWRHLSELVGSLCRPDLFPTLILTGWTADPDSGRDWRDYYPGDDHISVLAWDPYNSAMRVPTEYLTPFQLNAPVIAASTDSGKPWGIAETGSMLVPGDNGIGRAAWLNATGRFLNERGAVFVAYFQSTRDGDFKLADEPSIAAWRSWVGRRGRDDLAIHWSADRPAQLGSAPVEVDSATIDGGVVLPAEQTPTGATALRFPAFVDADVIPRAAIRVLSTGDRDDLDPGERDFRFGTDVNLDPLSSGSSIDNGDNLIQRGISSDPVLFKAEIDGRRPACTVRGDRGEVVVRAAEEVTPGQWYRVECVRRGDRLSVEVYGLDATSNSAISVQTQSGPIGSVTFTDPAIPLSVGGKLAANGAMIRSATDQFNGLLAQPTLTIDR